jgi:SH3 domain protein
VKKLIIGLGCALLSTSLYAQTQERFVSDTYYIQLRADKTNTSASVKSGIVSGTRLTLLREDRGEDGQLWALVQTQDGAEGWTRSSNLIDKPTAAIQLARMPEGARNAVALQTENDMLKQQLQTVQESYEQLLADTEDTRQTATTALNLEDENQRLLSEHQILQTRADTLNAENEYLRKNDMYSQWLHGGLLLVSGIVISFLLQMIGRRRRSSEWR